MRLLSQLRQRIRPLYCTPLHCLFAHHYSHFPIPSSNLRTSSLTMERWKRRITGFFCCRMICIRSCFLACEYRQAWTCYRIEGAERLREREGEACVTTEEKAGTWKNGLLDYHLKTPYLGTFISLISMGGGGGGVRVWATAPSSQRYLSWTVCVPTKL